MTGYEVEEIRDYAYYLIESFNDTTDGMWYEGSHRAFETFANRYYEGR